MANQTIHAIEVRGEYLYINNHSIQFTSEKAAEDFLTRLIVEEGFLDR